MILLPSVNFLSSSLLTEFVSRLYNSFNAGIYLEFWVKGPLAHPPKIPGAVNKPGVWGPQAPSGVQGQCPSRVQGKAPWAKIDFNHFLCAQTASPGVFFFFFYNNKLAFSPSETNKKQNVENLHNV